MEKLQENSWYIRGCDELGEYFNKIKCRWAGDDSLNGYYIANGKWGFSFIKELQDRTELTYPEFIKLFEGGDDYPAKRLQPLFDHLHSEHGLILHESEMEEIIRIVNNLNSNQ